MQLMLWQNGKSTTKLFHKMHGIFLWLVSITVWIEFVTWSLPYSLMQGAWQGLVDTSPHQHAGSYAWSCILLFLGCQVKGSSPDGPECQVLGSCRACHSLAGWLPWVKSKALEMFQPQRLWDWREVPWSCDPCALGLLKTTCAGWLHTWFSDIFGTWGPKDWGTSPGLQGPDMLWP